MKTCAYCNTEIKHFNKAFDEPVCFDDDCIEQAFTLEVFAVVKIQC